MRILIVDDDEITLSLLAHTIGKAGYEVECANTGRQALERLRQGGIRLVVTDWDMPDMDGLELCRAVRQGEFDGYVYIILVTSHDSPEEIVEGLSAGADDFLAKPFHAAELTVRLRAGQRVLSLETREMVIFALARLAESRDPEIGLHLERVQNYSRVLAQRLAHYPRFADQIDAEFIRLIYLTSPLHDIGKVGVPDCVLLKPGRLSTEEFEIMKTHAALGAETLEAALAKFPDARFLQVARDIAASHHERWDGNGYPQGLSGEAIPLSGRIVTLADVYDALTSKRVYKDAFSHTVARSMIVQESGSHFDVDVVQAFVECEEEFIDIARRFAPANAERLVAV